MNPIFRVADVDAALKILEGVTDDAEEAHRLQDELLEAVLHAVALGSVDAQDLADHALRVFDIDFPRHMA